MNSARMLVMLVACAILTIAGCGKKKSESPPSSVSSSTPAQTSPSSDTTATSTNVTPPPTPPTGKPATSEIVEQAGGIPALLASDLFTQGRQQFITNCTACHGEHGEAKPYLGKDIAHSAFVAARTDDQLADYIKTGRPVDDPLNTTGVPMPPKGGNPAISDAQIHQIIAYIRVLQAAARGEIELPSS